VGKLKPAKRIVGEVAGRRLLRYLDRDLATFLEVRSDASAREPLALSKLSR
jgi:hypothetical protein